MNMDPLTFNFLWNRNTSFRVIQLSQFAASSSSFLSANSFLEFPRPTSETFCGTVTLVSGSSNFLNSQHLLPRFYPPTLSLNFRVLHQKTSGNYLFIYFKSIRGFHSHIRRQLVEWVEFNCLLDAYHLRRINSRSGVVQSFLCTQSACCNASKNLSPCDFLISLTFG
ncbi:unnamed protein product [Coffea canephora]|uniref:DH200=94 genomic scaffold, scaffold_227 n=1 Tax=Coffea canephora TaxID=49390 RepID=A0A068VBX3_COFCA|nr:unnamed protein product [Coffea canephora]